MSLVTRCPQCSTLFRVTPAHLQVAGGQVRCGRCTHVFDGYQALTQLPEPGLAPTPPPGEGPVQPSAPGLAPTATAPTPTPPDSRAARPFAFEAPREKSPHVRAIVWIVVLASLFTLQMAYAFRAEFVARSVGLRSTLESVCEFAGCTVRLPQRPDLLRIEASDVHIIDPARPSLIQVTATLRSYAKHDLAYPALDLVLTNANEHALARRVFNPDDYIGAGRNPKAGIPPNAEITVALDLESGDINAAGFRLDLLPAPR